jgi:RNA polymerase sigma factor (sigma-70 family)
MGGSESASSDFDHLFRRESGRMVATVTRIFGTQNLALAQDVVQDAFWRALEIWNIRGVPENPSAWLMTTAKNRALDALRRERTARSFAPDIDLLLRSEWTLAPALEELFDANAIRDDLLRMMFSCCDPRLTEEAQVALILHILCGFSVDEIAGAFVSSHAAIEKRITRAKKVLATAKNLFDIGTAAEFSARLPAVHRALYLLFNEGYHAASPEAAIRAELCGEAIRLATILLENEFGATPASFALSSLMYLDAARLPARMDSAGGLISLQDQDRAQWDQKSIARGLELLERSAAGAQITPYHVEAAIAAVHAGSPGVDSTDWKTIVSLYDTLIVLNPSPIVALNRAIAVAQCEGAERGIQELRAVENSERLSRYPFYEAAFGELELRCGRSLSAHAHFQKAAALARNAMERQFFDGRVAACARGG